MAAVTPATASERVLAVVLNFNGGDDVLACLDSLALQVGARLEVLVIDNASSDGSLAAIRERHPEVEVLANAENLGFCAANNLGLERALAAGFDAALLLNDDVTLEPDSVARMVAALAAGPRVGVVGPKVLFDPERGFIWCAGGTLDYRQNLNRLRGHWCPADSFAESGPVDYVPGCALLIRREALEQVGLFAADYFAYLEDVELCHRVRRAGFEVYYEAEARVYHRVSRASGSRYGRLRKYLNARNSVHFLRRHGTLRGWFGFILFDLLSWPAVWVREAMRGRGGAARAKARGLRAGFRGLAGPPPAREFERD